MGLKERLFGKPKGFPVETFDGETPSQTFGGFMAKLRDGESHSLCVFPWEKIVNGKGSKTYRTYGLKYTSRIYPTEQIVSYNEVCAENVPFSLDFHFRNSVTAIDRIRFLGKALGIEGFITIGPKYLDTAVDSDVYDEMMTIANAQGIKPFPFPVPQTFEKITVDAAHLAA